MSHAVLLPTNGTHHHADPRPARLLSYGDAINEALHQEMAGADNGPAC